MDDIRQKLNAIYEALDGASLLEDYVDRHGIKSEPILTVIDDRMASAIAAYLVPRIEGKTVVEIGGGIGLLACHLGLYAKRIFVIEANPVWSQAFVACLLAGKPKNVSYLYGAADEFAGLFQADLKALNTAAATRETLDEYLRRSAEGKTGIFRDHSCWKCKDGSLPCAKGHSLNCDYPRARND